MEQDASWVKYRQRQENPKSFNPFTADPVKALHLPYWSNPPFLIFDKKKRRLDQYGAGPFEQQQFGTIEGVNLSLLIRGNRLSAFDNNGLNPIVNK